MFELSVKQRFSAAHHLRGYAGTCAAQHGHNWDVEVFVGGERLDASGLLVDFRSLKNAIGKVLGEIDHSDLNTLDAFQDMNPTSENVARLLYGRLSAELANKSCRVLRVRVSETPETAASYWE